MSWESPFLRLSSVFNKVSQKNFDFQQQTISNQQKYWSVASFVHLQLLKKPTKHDNNAKILEKAHS